MIQLSRPVCSTSRKKNVPEHLRKSRSPGGTRINPPPPFPPRSELFVGYFSPLVFVLFCSSCVSGPHLQLSSASVHSHRTRAEEKPTGEGDIPLLLLLLLLLLLSSFFPGCGIIIQQTPSAMNRVHPTSPFLLSPLIPSSLSPPPPSRLSFFVLGPDLITME